MNTYIPKSNMESAILAALPEPIGSEPMYRHVESIAAEIEYTSVSTLNVCRLMRDDGGLVVDPDSVLRFSRVPQDATGSGSDLARFTRVSGNRWAIASKSAVDAHSSVMVDRKDGEPVRMVTGEYLHPHKKLEGWHCYAIDKGRGGKAPTSGRMGKNSKRSRGKGGKRSKGSIPSQTPPADDFEPVTDDDIQQAAQAAVTPQPDTPAGTPINALDFMKEVQAAIDKGDSDVLAELQDGLGSMSVELAKLRVPSTIDIHAPQADGTDKVTHIDGAHHSMPDVLENLLLGIHTYLVGPAGSGKTHLGESCATALGRDLAICGAMLTKHEVTGYQDASGRYITTAAREAYEKGYVLLWDEVDASMPAALVAVNAMLSNQRYTFPDATIERHPDFIVIAAGNTYGTGADRKYVGRLQLDGATLDRFAFVPIDYDEVLESTLAFDEYARFGGLDTERCSDWVKHVQALRQSAQEAGVEHIISPRAAMYGARKLTRLDVGESWDKIIEQVVWKGISTDQRTVIEKGVWS